jgi:hypothetical protein
MKSTKTLPRATIAIVACSTFALGMLAGCGKATVPMKVSGGRSGIYSTDSLASQMAQAARSRRAALLGLFVAEYLANAPAVIAAQGGINGIVVQQMIIAKQQTVADPDFDLIQAFGDALQVEVPDLLNRSVDRQLALDTYAEALTNVATRANDRFKELNVLLDDLTLTSRQQNKEKSAAERELKKAMDSKDFTDAGEKQKLVLEKAQAFADTDLQLKQTQNVVNTLNKFLTLYGQKILAIQQNREVLISGNKVVSVPGIDQLKLIEKAPTTRTPSARGGSTFDSLFEDTKML